MRCRGLLLYHVALGLLGMVVSFTFHAAAWVPEETEHVLGWVFRASGGMTLGVVFLTAGPIIAIWQGLPPSRLGRRLDLSLRGWFRRRPRWAQIAMRIAPWVLLMFAVVAGPVSNQVPWVGAVPPVSWVRQATDAAMEAISARGLAVASAVWFVLFGVLALVAARGWCALAKEGKGAQPGSAESH